MVLISRPHSLRGLRFWRIRPPWGGIMLNFRRAPSMEDSARSANHDPYFGSTGPARPRTFVKTKRAGWLAMLGPSPKPRPFVSRRLSPERGRALEVLGHAIEYLADEY